MSRIEVITSVQRWRRWSWEEKERIVAASRLPGAVAFEVARRAEIPVSQLFRWRRQLGARGRAGPAFAAVAVAPADVAPASATPPGFPSGSPTVGPEGVIEIEFAAGARVRLSGAVDPATVSAVIGALMAARRR